MTTRPLISSSEGKVHLAWTVDSIHLADLLVTLLEENGIDASFTTTKAGKAKVKASFSSDKSDYAGFAGYLYHYHEMQVTRFERALKL